MDSSEKNFIIAMFKKTIEAVENCYLLDTGEFHTELRTLLEYPESLSAVSEDETPTYKKWMGEAGEAVRSFYKSLGETPSQLAQGVIGYTVFNEKPRNNFPW